MHLTMNRKHFLVITFVKKMSSTSLPRKRKTFTQNLTLTGWKYLTSFLKGREVINMRFVLFVIPISPLSSFRSCGYFTNRQEIAKKQACGRMKSPWLVYINYLCRFTVERERKVLVTKHVTWLEYVLNLIKPKIFFKNKTSPVS